MYPVFTGLGAGTRTKSCTTILLLAKVKCNRPRFKNTFIVFKCNQTRDKHRKIGHVMVTCFTQSWVYRRLKDRAPDYSSSGLSRNPVSSLSSPRVISLIMIPIPPEPQRARN